MNIAGYCQSLGYLGATQGNTVDDWHCTTSTTSIDFNALCQQQYQAGAVAYYTNVNDPTSWSCYAPTSTNGSRPTPAPTPAPPRLGGEVPGELPFLSAISVQASGLGAVIRFTSSEPTSADVSVTPDVTTGAPSGYSPLGGAAGTVCQVCPVTFETSHQRTVTNLTSNTLYDVDVSAQTQSGANLSGHAQFQTAKERIRVTVDSIDVVQSGAIFGGTDANWLLSLGWGAGPGFHSPLAEGGTSICYPYFSNTGCVTYNFGQETYQPIDNYSEPLAWVFSEENFDFMPKSFIVGATVSADPGAFSEDLGFLSTHFFPMGCGSSNTWQVPQGVESGSGTASCGATDSDNGFESVVTFRFELFYDSAAYPVPHMNMPTDPWAPK